MAEAQSAHWASRSEIGVYLGIRFMLGAYSIFGRWLFTPILCFVVGYFMIFAGDMRRSSRKFLEHVWAQPEGKITLGRRPSLITVLRHLVSFGDSLLDKLATWRGDIGPDLIDYENRELFERRVKEGNGGIWMASHLGNMEVCRALSRTKEDARITVLVHTHHAKNFNRLMREINPDSELEMYQVTDFGIATAMILQEKISQGRFVVVVGDRTPIANPEAVAFAPFLGEDAPFPTGPFLLAGILDCPIGLMFCIKRNGRFLVRFENFEALEQMDRQNRAEVLQRAVVAYAGRLETFAVKYPMQWFNFFDFWPAGSPDAGQDIGQDIGQNIGEKLNDG